jgi:dihydrofolate synthase / folylpolyglutamate synthase
VKITPIKTCRIAPNQKSIFEVLEEFLPEINERSVVAITSKIVSLCEGRVVPAEGVELEELVKSEADYYLAGSPGKFDQRFTITNNLLSARAGIDYSRQNDCYILLPADPQKTANDVRLYLKQKHKLGEVGVLITDSISSPLRRGVTGTLLSHSGFRALNDYKTSRANVAAGLAAAAVLVMGEGSEQTPIAIAEDIPFINFQPRNPNKHELDDLYLKLEEDFFAPFLQSAEWQPGKKQ